MPLFAQNKRINGTIVDSNKEPIIGANVQVKGTTVGTITDLDGNFTLDAPQSGTLVISFIGYKTQEIPLGQITYNITIQEDSEMLSEVVVIGYGMQRKEAITGSVASANAETLRAVPGSNFTQALQGRIAGIEMTQTSSKPGAEMQIRIRGARSLTASNDPLVVLDGIPFVGSIGDININTIKSIDILKDASATAIYGSRGANGVILITTLRGEQGSKARVSYNGYFGIKDLFAKYPMMNGAEFAQMRKDAGIYNNALDESDDTNTDWQDLFYRTGFVTSHDVSVTGGTQKGSYSFDAGYYKDEAVVPMQDFERMNLRGAFDQEIGVFRVGITTNNNYTVNNGNSMGLYGVLSNSPIANPYNEDGTLKRTIRMPLDESWVQTKSVMENLGDAWADRQKAFSSYNTLYAEAKIPQVEGLKYRINLGLNYRTTDGGQYTGQGLFSSNETAQSKATVTNSLMTNWAIENMLTYDRNFGKHQVNAVALYSAERTKYTTKHITANDIPADHFQYFNLGQATGDVTIDPSKQIYQVSSLMSWMGRVMYSYDNKYMLSVTLRSDGSSRLAPGHKWHTYPAFSAGWNIKRESFMDNVTWLDNLKLRVGYGQTSNQAVDPYKTLGLLSTRKYNFGNEFSTGNYVTELPNAALGWEYSETWNFGLDFTLFNGRLSGTMEYYVQNTKDLLMGIGLPSTSGVSSYMANIGETQNKGFELSLNGTILENRNGWTWDAGVNLYVNHNKLVALASGQKRDETNNWFKGHPIDVIYDFEKIGLWQEGDPYMNILEPGGNAGMIKVKYTGDYNADGTPVRQIGNADRQIISMEPRFQGGFNTRVAYKGFDLSIVGAFKSGGKLISTLYSSAGYLNMMTGRRGNVKVDYWTPENTGAKYPKPGGAQSGDNPKYGSTLGYFDASYLKIRTITLGYNFDQLKWLKDNGISRLRVYATVQNPFVFFSPYHDESGMDPETNSYGNENAAVPYDDNLKRLLTIGTNSPATRNYILGINFTF
ncbi:TonB-dependent receptor [Bacteroides sp. 51]|uniref:SusC/RagA family TonB-linked outer membrane protein n=1 Tax=Bacteroides sp. 51 TaxID=2302938 RepID=UPI0013D33559|nr:TonB-dependent receptor [Bacteroides sp. 51]NDV81604.1 TonB-dependent receptor [Bacteroides sp. 51]